MDTPPRAIRALQKDGTGVISCCTCEYPLADIAKTGSRVVCPECGTEQEIADDVPALAMVGFWHLVLSMAGVWLGALCAGPVIFVAAPGITFLLAIGVSGIVRVTPPVTKQRQLRAAIVAWLVANIGGGVAAAAAMLLVL